MSACVTIAWLREDLLLLVFLASTALACPSQAAPPDMAVIAGGVFRPFFRAQADPKEIPVKSFALDVLPVTNQDFLEFVRANPRWQRSRVKRIFADDSYLKHWESDLVPGNNALASVPVTFVSWFAAKAYAQWKGKRLPTMAEWEYAASASPVRPDGENDPAFKRRVLEWYSSPTLTLASVGRDPKNYWGIRDLHGLVWEWVADFSTAMVTGDSRGESGLDRQLFCGAGAQNAMDRAN
jgi:formylglycine-generating enzyme